MCVQKGAYHLDGHSRGHLEEIGVANKGVLGLDGLKHLDSGGKACSNVWYQGDEIKFGKLCSHWWTSKTPPKPWNFCSRKNSNYTYMLIKSGRKNACLLITPAYAQSPFRQLRRRMHLWIISIEEIWQIEATEPSSEEDQAPQLTSVGTVGDLRLEADGADGTAALGPIGDGLVVGARVVPGKANHEGIRVGFVQKLSKSLLALLELLDLLSRNGSAHGKLERGAAATCSSGKRGSAQHRRGRRNLGMGKVGGGRSDEGLSPSGEGDGRNKAWLQHCDLDGMSTNNADPFLFRSVCKKNKKREKSFQTEIWFTSVGNCSLSGALRLLREPFNSMYVCTKWVYLESFSIFYHCVTLLVFSCLFRFWFVIKVIKLLQGVSRVFLRHVAPTRYGDQTLSAGEHLAPGFSQWRLALAAWTFMYVCTKWVYLESSSHEVQYFYHCITLLVFSCLSRFWFLIKVYYCCSDGILVFAVSSRKFHILSPYLSTRENRDTPTWSSDTTTCFAFRLERPPRKCPNHSCFESSPMRQRRDWVPETAHRTHRARMNPSPETSFTHKSMNTRATKGHRH